MNSKSSNGRVNTSGFTASSRESDINNFLDSFWRCRIYDPSMDTKYGGNNGGGEKTVNFGNDLVKIPGPMAYNIGDVTCTLCNKKVNSKYIIRRDHIIKEHADVIIDNVVEKTDSSKANYLYTIFMVIKTAFPNCKVYSDIQCIVCTKSIKTTAGMHTHMGTVHKLAPYECPYEDCHLIVCYKNKILDHLKSAHNKVIDLKDMDCVDRETRILKNFEDSRKEFFAKIIDDFFPVNIDWYEDDLKGKNGHVYSIFDNLQKERLVIKNNNIVDKGTSSSKSSLKLNEKYNNRHHPRHQVKERENETIEIDLNKKISTTNDSRYFEISSFNSDKKNPSTNCGSSQKSGSIVNLKDNKTTRNSNHEKMNNKVKDNSINQRNSVKQLIEDGCGRNTYSNNKIPLRKPSITAGVSSNGFRKRNLGISPSTDRTNNSPEGASKKPSPKGCYNPLSEACPIKKTKIDRYTKRITNPESLRTNNDKIQYNRSEEEDRKVREIKHETSSIKVSKNVCNIQMMDNTKSVIRKKEVSTTSHKNTSNNIMTGSTKSETENTKKYLIEQEKRALNIDKDTANDKEIGKVNDSLSRVSTGLGTADSPICIDDDDSPSEVEDRINSRSVTESNTLRKEEKSNNNRVGFESLYQTLERIEAEKSSSTSNPLFENAMEISEDISLTPDSNMRPRDPRLNKINKFSGQLNSKKHSGNYPSSSYTFNNFLYLEH
uniref:C2H2-type domain-containing protein n=1 Tax=Strongyloides venezuelensis TaxID=75913 RepID=A0A0K0FMH4_STRVS